MLLFLLGLASTYLGVLLLERLIQPSPAGPQPLIHRMSLLTAMPGIMLYLTFFMISYRAVFSLALTLLVYTAIVIVNNAKYRALNEPLVFSDFALLRQAVRHPRLYVKYIGVFNIVMVAVTAVVLTTGAVLYEPPLVKRNAIADFFPAVIYLFVLLGMIYAATRGPFRQSMRNLLLRFGPTTDITRDKDQISIVVCLIVYFFLANEPDPARARARRHLARHTGSRANARASPHPRLPAAELPDIVTVQNESFFDARRISSALNGDLLASFDALAGEACYTGRLAVPAFGANTMRTEFEVLSGLPNDALGVHRFNPYLQLGKRPVWTLASQLRALGYRTVCIHPFAANFFDRDEVYPNLGFDAFLDIESFPGAEHDGLYISDAAVADKVREVLGDHSQPVFVFAITMENHGKWEPGRLDAATENAILADPPLGSPELGRYLHHLRNADAMLERLAGLLKTRPRGGVLCFFGDHIPSFPSLFRNHGFHDARTDYCIWRTGGGESHRLDVPAHALGRLVLDAALAQAAPQSVEAAAS